MTEIVRHTSAGEKGRIYSRRKPSSDRKNMTDPAAPNGATGGTFSPPAVMPAGIPHPNLLEHLGPAYVATPDGMITWHNDAFLVFSPARRGTSPMTPNV